MKLYTSLTLVGLVFLASCGNNGGISLGGIDPSLEGVNINLSDGNAMTIQTEDGTVQIGLDGTMTLETVEGNATLNEQGFQAVDADGNVTTGTFEGSDMTITTDQGQVTIGANGTTIHNVDTTSSDTPVIQSGE